MTALGTLNQQLQLLLLHLKEVPRPLIQPALACLPPAAEGALLHSAELTRLWGMPVLRCAPELLPMLKLISKLASGLVQGHQCSPQVTSASLSPPILQEILDMGDTDLSTAYKKTQGAAYEAWLKSGAPLSSALPETARRRKPAKAAAKPAAKPSTRPVRAIKASVPVHA